MTNSPSAIRGRRWRKKQQAIRWAMKGAREFPGIMFTALFAGRRYSFIVETHAKDQQRYGAYHDKYERETNTDHNPV